MARIDVPTLKCDRCGETTQDTKRMAEFQQLRRTHIEGRTEWDLCPTCWRSFQNFMACQPVGEDMCLCGHQLVEHIEDEDICTKKTLSGGPCHCSRYRGFR